MVRSSIGKLRQSKTQAKDKAEKAAAAAAGGDGGDGDGDGDDGDGGDGAMALPHEAGPLTAAARAEYVRPMFEVSWGPLIGAFSLLLETTADATVIELCLAGFRHAVCRVLPPPPSFLPLRVSSSSFSWPVPAAPYVHSAQPR
jgi:hypothetical protein